MYYSLEDGYYAVLDKIQRVIPIYSIVDPIDRVFPSFILVILIILALVAGGLFLVLQHQSIPAEYNGSILLVDDAGNPVQNVDVTVAIGETSRDYSTNSHGLIIVLLKTKTASGKVSVAATGYKEIVDQSVELDSSAAEPAKITLLRADAISFDTDFTVNLLNSQTNSPIRDATINVVFHCSQSTTSPPTPVNMSTSQGMFVVHRISTCGTLSADFNPQTGYQSKPGFSIISNPTNVPLDPIRTEPVVGNFRVTVTDANTGAKIKGAKIKYWEAANSGDQTAGPDSDANGRSLVSNISPGYYKVSAFATDGRNAQTPTSFEVKKNQTVEVPLALPAISNAKRIFIKVVDKNSQEILSDATVRLYDNQLLLSGPGSTNANGIVEQAVDKKWDSHFSAVLYKQGFLITVKDPLSIVDANVTTPITIELERALTSAAGVPVNYGLALVKTVSEDTPPVSVPTVKVALYKTDYPNPLFFTDTNLSGEIRIFNLPPTTSANSYYATGSKAELEATGRSQNNTLALGGTSILLIPLFVATGNFEITAQDAATPNTKLAGAGVTAFVSGSSGDVFLGSCTTAAVTGKCRIEGVKTNKIVRFDVNKNNYLTFHSAALHTEKDQTVQVTARLTFSSKLPGDACSATDACPSPMACTGNLCVATCNSGLNSDCYNNTNNYSGFYCDQDHTCKPGPFTACTSNANCTNMETCNLNTGLCEEPLGKVCSTAADCGDLICDASTNPDSCQDPTGRFCSNDAACGGNTFVCKTNACARSCTANANCQAGFVCNVAAGICENPGARNEIEFKFVELLDADAQALDNGHLMKTGTRYNAAFDLVLHQATVWNDVFTHVRAGDDNHLNASDNNVRIVGVTLINGATGEASYSTTANLTNIFSDPDGPTDPDGTQYKQTNTHYATVAPGTYVLLVEFDTMPNLSVGTPIELHFAAKGIKKVGTVTTNWATPSHQKNFEIGGSTCVADCPPFAWQFFLNSQTSTPINPGLATVISENAQFSLYYILRNQSSTNFTTATVNALSPDSVFLLTPYTISGALNGQSATRLGLQNPVLFSTNPVENTSLSGDIQFNVATAPTSSDATASKSVLFSVQSGKELRIEVWQFTTDKFTIIVKDKLSGTVVSGAALRFKFNYCNENDYQTAVLEWNSVPGALTGTDGRFTDDALKSDRVGACMVVEASKTGYHTTRFFDQTGIDSAFGNPLTCIKVDLNPSTATQELFRELLRGETEVALSITSVCDQAYEINLYTFPEIEESITLTGVGDATTSVELPADGNINATADIADDSVLGYIPLILRVSQNGVPTFVTIAAEYIINDEDKTYNITKDDSEPPLGVVP